MGHMLAEFIPVSSPAQQLWLISHRGAVLHGPFWLQGRLGMVSSAGTPAVPNKSGILFRRKKGKAEGGFD